MSILRNEEIHVIERIKRMLSQMFLVSVGVLVSTEPSMYARKTMHNTTLHRKIKIKYQDK